MGETIYILILISFFVGLVLGINVGRASRQRKRHQQNVARASAMREELRELMGDDSGDE